MLSIFAVVAMAVVITIVTAGDASSDAEKSGSDLDRHGDDRGYILMPPIMK
jgi:hypothetical protein